MWADPQNYKAEIPRIKRRVPKPVIAGPGRPTILVKSRKKPKNAFRREIGGTLQKEFFLRKREVISNTAVQSHFKLS